VTSLSEVLAQDRRLVVLRTLEEAPGYQLNEGALEHVLNYLGHQVGRDMVRADLQFLLDHDLVRKEILRPPSGELWLLKLTNAGGEVARGRPHPGVARRDPD